MQPPETHDFYMRRALELARLGIGTTRPNPVVGAVIVRDGHIVGEGYHAQAGEAHAEVEAIRSAGEETRGATMYVTLEPCNHEGRTPPCTQAIVEAGIEHVYFASPDPNPHVEGGGAAFLRRLGIPCTEGPLSDEANYLNRGFSHWIRTGRPWIINKFAASLDGSIATRTGESQWITGPEARQRGHELRHEVDAILVGVGTIVADDPLLTVRGSTFHVPRSTPKVALVRIILDSRGRSPRSASVFEKAPGANTLVATTDMSDPRWRRTLSDAGVDVVVVDSDSKGRVSTQALVDELGTREIRSVLVEGGPTIHGSFFDAGLVNEVFAFIAPMVIGGLEAPGAVGGLGAPTLSTAMQLDSVRTEQCGADLLVRGLVAGRAHAGEPSPHEAHGFVGQAARE